MAISSYGNGTVVVYEVGAAGLPVASSAREMVIGLTGAEGALIDQVHPVILRSLTSWVKTL